MVLRYPKPPGLGSESKVVKYPASEVGQLDECATGTSGSSIKSITTFLRDDCHYGEDRHVSG